MFSGHEHDEHSPFANSNSKQKTAEQGITGVDFTSLSMQWQGKEVYPADAYDGKQGSGYPTPTGARDEYSVGNQKRYTQNDLDGMNAEYRKLNSGTKTDMHKDQTQNIREYQEKNGTRPKYNKSDY